MTDSLSNLGMTSEGVGAATVATLMTMVGLYYYYHQQGKKMKRKTIRYPPNPQPSHFIFGNALDMPDTKSGRAVDEKLLYWAKEGKMGSVYSVNIVNLMRLIVVADPEWIHHILVTRNITKSYTMKSMIPMLGENSIVLSNGEQPERHRKIFSPAFGPKFLRKMISTMCDKIIYRYVVALDGDVQSDAVTNMLDRAQHLTADILVQIAFGEDWGEEEGQQQQGSTGTVPVYDNKTSSFAAARNMLNELSTITAVRAIPIINFQQIQRRRRLDEQFGKLMNDVVDRRLAQLIKSSMKERKTSKVDINDEIKDNVDDDDDDDITKYNDICSLAIKSMMNNTNDGNKDKDNDKEEFSLSNDDRNVVVDQLRTFYFAGHDTTATAIAWAGWLLSQHPHVVSKLRRELSDAKILFYHHHDGDHDHHDNMNKPTSTEKVSYPTYEELQNCKYLDAVVKETLRLYPPAGGARYTSDTDETFRGYTLGKAILYICPYVLHRLEEYWGADAERFVPERFVDVPVESYQHKYVPFSKGKRDCLGKYFALMEIKLSIVVLVQKYDMECINVNECLGYHHTTHPFDGAKVKLSHFPNAGLQQPVVQ